MTPARRALVEAAAAESARVYGRTLAQHRAEHAVALMRRELVVAAAAVSGGRVVDLGERRARAAALRS